MKLTTKKLNALSCLYLHGDGHAVAVFEKTDRQAGKIKWVEVWQNFGPKCRFEGRLIFGHFYPTLGKFGLTTLIQSALEVRATKPTLTGGSENSQSKGQLVGYLEITGKDYSINLYELPMLLAGEYTYQPENKDSWESVKDRYHWADYNITAKHVVTETVAA